MKLFVLADDMTGAMDTAVKFVEAGFATHVAVDAGDVLQANGAQVIVLNADSRHLPAEQAYRAVYDATRKAVEAGAEYFYKKVDSSLRGNIGAELSAMLDATGEQRLVFLPAFPRMGRTTRNGFHWVNGRLVQDSEYGADPFESVTDSFIPNIIAQQSPIPVTIHPDGQSRLEDGINVFDSSSEDDIRGIVRDLFSGNRMKVMAGSAGLAEALPEHLKTAADKPPCEPGGKRLLVLCGSVNPVARRQIDYARGQGFAYCEYQGASDPGGLGETQYQGIRAEWDKGRHLIIASQPVPSLDRDILARDRAQVSKNLSALFARLLEDGVDAVFLVTGGDTLYAALQNLGIKAIEPRCELLPGAVYAHAGYQGRVIELITKAGGFGDERFYVQLQQKILDRKGETVCTP